MTSLVRRPRPRAAIALTLAIAVPLSACQSVELSEEVSPGTVGSIRVHVHNGLFDEVPQPGYTVTIYPTRSNQEPLRSEESEAGQPLWLRAVSPGRYRVDVRYGGPAGQRVHSEEVSVKADTITSLRIESRAHDKVKVGGSSAANIGGATVELLGALAYGVGAVLWVGLVIGAATAPIWVPLALGKKKDD